MSSEALLPPIDDAAAGSPVAPADTTPDLPSSSVEAARRTGFLSSFWVLSLAVVLIDQVTKALVTAALPVYSSQPLIPGLVDLVHVQNAGVAFGIFNDVEHPLRSLFTIALALLALVGIGYYARQLRPEERVARIGLSLILGGAVGNLIDRVRQGFVTDFVDVYWHDWHFWAFNAADAAITIGAVLIVVELFVSNRHVSGSH
jgi:signal peptidase II